MTSVEPLRQSLRCIALPNYTAERYFLLSELEQCVRFHFLDDDKGTKGGLFEGDVIAFYILWEMASQNTLGLLEDVATLFASSRAIITKRENKPRFLLAVEVLRDGSIKDAQRAIDEVYAHLRRHSHFDCVLFGISDKVSGTAAIEAIYDCAMALSHVMIPTSSSTAPLPVMSFIAQSRLTCLGHDASRQPDADSNVSQLLMVSTDAVNLSTWAVPDFDTLQCNAQRQSEGKVLNRMHSKLFPSSWLVLILIAVVVAFASICIIHVSRLYSAE